MNKVISFSLASLAILAPNVAFSQPRSQNITPAEKELIRSFVCSNEDYTREEVISTINTSNLSISNTRRNKLADRRNKLADAIMSGQQVPEENKTLICES